MEIKNPVKFIIKGVAKVLTPEENAKLKVAEAYSKEKRTGLKDTHGETDVRDHKQTDDV